MNLPQSFSLIFFDPLLMEALLYYIVLLYSIPPSTCLLSSLVLEFLSPFPQLFDFLGVIVVETTVQRSSPPLFRGLLHINAARKAAVMHLMRW